MCMCVCVCVCVRVCVCIVGCISDKSRSRLGREKVKWK